MKVIRNKVKGKSFVMRLISTMINEVGRRKNLEM